MQGPCGRKTELWLLLLLAIALLRVSSAFPCSDLTGNTPYVYTIESEAGYFEIQGFGGVLWPKNVTTGAPLKSLGNLNYGILAFQEGYNSPLIPTTSCPDRNSTEINMMEIVLQVTPQDMECTLSSVWDETQSNVTHVLDAWYYNATQQALGLGPFHVQMNFSNVTIAYQTTIGPYYNFSTGAYFSSVDWLGVAYTDLNYTISYVPNSVKISLLMENWPWQLPEGQSYFVANYSGTGQFLLGAYHYSGSGYDGSAYYAESHVNYLEDEILVANGDYNLTQSVNHQLTFVMSDSGQSYNWVKTFANQFYKQLAGPVPIIKPASFSGGLSSCIEGVGPGYHFSAIRYDPTLASIFTGIIGNPSNSPKDNTALIVGLVVSLGGVTALCVGVILLATFVPKFKFILRPFSRPKTLRSTAA